MYDFSFSNSLIAIDEYVVFGSDLRKELNNDINSVNPKHLDLVTFYLYLYSVIHDLDLVRWLNISSKDKFESHNRRICEKASRNLLYFLAKTILGTKPVFTKNKRLLDRVKELKLGIELSCLEPHISILKKYNSDVNSQYLFDYICLYCHLSDEENVLHSMHEELEKIENNQALILGIFSKCFPFARTAYEQYIDFCDDNSLTSICHIENPNRFFGCEVQTSLPSKYKTYYPQLGEMDAKIETVRCFGKLFNELKNKGYLDADCRVIEFLWAFGLLDECPERYQRIAFHSLTATHNPEIGNSAFQCFLVLLGYTLDEIKSFRSNKGKKNLINELFVLTVDRRTSFISKDELILKEIIKSSGLPVNLK